MTTERRRILIPLDKTVVNGQSTHRKDIKDPKTIVTFTFSPQDCSRLCDSVLTSNAPPADEEHLRPFVCFTPIIGYGNDSGWDSDTTYDIPFLSRKSKEDRFVTWGITETIEREQLCRLTASSHLVLPGFVQVASIGVLEELIIEPSDVKVAYPKPGIQPPITVNDLEIVTKRKFSIDFSPLGVIFNEQRKSSPICAVVSAQINSNRGFRSKENMLPAIDSAISNLHSALLRVATQMGDSGFYPEYRVDTWGQMVAQFWLENFNEVERIRTKTTHTIYLDDFLQLEKAILGVKE